MKIFLFILAGFFVYYNLHCDYKSKIDSLDNQLENFDGKEKLKILNNIIDICLNSSPKKAITYAEMSLSLSKELQDRKEESNALHNIGNGYYFLGEFENALKYYLKSLKIKEELGEPNSIAGLLNNIAIIHGIINNFDASLKYSLKALEIHKKVGNNKGIARTLHNIGMVYENLGDYNKALDYYKKSLKIKEELKDKQSLSYAYHNIALIYYNLKKYKEALDYNLKALKIREKLDDKFGISSTLNNLGMVYTQLGNYEKGLNCLDRSMEIARKEKFSDLIKDAYLSYSDFYSAKNDYQNSLKNFKLFSSLKDSLLNEKMRSKISNIQGKYNIEKEENENKILRIDNKNKRNQLYLTVVIFFLVITILVLIFLRFRKKRIINELISKKVEHELRVYSNQLEEIVKERTTDIQKLNMELEQRVIERTAELKFANEELEAFSYSVSHDLRAPLRAIDGFTKIMLDEYKGKIDDEADRLLNIIRSNAQKMGQLIDDILNFSHVGRIDLQKSKIDMNVMVNEIINDISKIIDVSDVHFNISPLPEALADRNLLRQVLVNLISNAVKFTSKKENRKIEISGYSENNEKIYYIKDNGVGFDDKYVDKLFNVFQRLHTSTEFEGTGVGLAIVKRIITKHRGKTWAEGKLNEGAAFYFTLPV